MSMKIVQVLEEIEFFREKLLALDETYADSSDFKNKLVESELYDFLSSIEILSSTGAFDNELLSAIVDLVNNEHLQKAVNFKRLDLSDLSIDESHPDNGDVEELINRKSENLYDEIRADVALIIEELNTKIEQLIFIPGSL